MYYRSSVFYWMQNKLNLFKHERKLFDLEFTQVVLFSIRSKK